MQTLLINIFNSGWLKDHQTLVASLIALSGLVAGWLATSSLSRRHADRIRHQDATALAALLAAEVHAMRHQARMLVIMFDQLHDEIAAKQESLNTKWEALAISYSRPRVFDKVSDKTGLLGARLAFRVSGFYFLLFDVFSGLEMLSKDNPTNAQVLLITKSLQEGLRKVWQSGTEVLPELIAFAHTKKRPRESFLWLVDEAQRLDDKVTAGISSFDPSQPFKRPPF